MRLSNADRRQLLALARESIDSALASGARLPCPRREWSAAQLEYRCAFVTLRMGSTLRGCCGSIEAIRPLADDVWRNAWASAFSDSRFPPLTAREWPDAHLHISVLQPAEALGAETEEMLLAQLRPGRDGLILELGAARATFLPSVWEQLPEAREFVRHLKHKAGLHADFWAPEIRISRYEAEGFSED